MYRAVVLGFVAAVVGSGAAALSTGSTQALAYEYPIEDPFIATIGGGFGVSLNVSERGGMNFDFANQTATTRKRSSAPPRNPNKVPVQILVQDDLEAPLIYVLPGSTGGTYRSGPARIIGDYFFGLGFHVITGVSTIQPNFVTAISRNRPMGETDADTHDLYVLLQRLKNYGRRVYGMRPRFSAVIGVSLGGYYAARMMMLDEQGKNLGLDRAILINSPIDLLYSMSTLDAQYSSVRYTAVTRSALVSSLYLKGAEAVVQNPTKDPKPFIKALKDIPSLRLFRSRTSEKVGYVIASRYRGALAKVVTLFQDIQGDSSIPPRESRLQRRKRLNQNRKKYDFDTYMAEYLDPYLRAKGADVEENRRKGNLKTYREFLERSSKIYYINNADDFLVNDDHLRFAREVFGSSRTKIYPRGGHVGNLWWPENLCYLQNIFKAEIPEGRELSSCDRR